MAFLNSKIHSGSINKKEFWEFWLDKVLKHISLNGTINLDDAYEIFKQSWIDPQIEIFTFNDRII